jgi:hypothetical protein
LRVPAVVGAINNYYFHFDIKILKKLTYRGCKLKFDYCVP